MLPPKKRKYSFSIYESVSMCTLLGSGFIFSMFIPISILTTSIQVGLVQPPTRCTLLCLEIYAFRRHSLHACLFRRWTRRWKTFRRNFNRPFVKHSWIPLSKVGWLMTIPIEGVEFVSSQPATAMYVFSLKVPGNQEVILWFIIHMTYHI